MKLENMLVVDDEKVIRDLFVRAFGSKYKVDTAGDGYEALRMIDEVKPGLVFLDLLMPGMNGMDVLRRVVAEHPDSRVVVMTGLAFEDMKNTALGIGAWGYLYKPFGLDEIEKYVEKRNE
jgi:DNA-binding NtrC family response regulator